VSLSERGDVASSEAQLIPRSSLLAASSYIALNSCRGIEWPELESQSLHNLRLESCKKQLVKRYLTALVTGSHQSLARDARFQG
jgi:hypothetical protein